MDRLKQLKDAGTLLITAGSGLTIAACGHLAAELDLIRDASEAGDWDKLGIIVVGHLVFAVIGLAIVVAGMLYRLEQKRIDGPAAKAADKTPMYESPLLKIPSPGGNADHVLQWVDPDANTKAEADATPKAQPDDKPLDASDTGVKLDREGSPFAAVPSGAAGIDIADVRGLEDRLETIHFLADHPHPVTIGPIGISEVHDLENRLRVLESAAHHEHIVAVKTGADGGALAIPVHAEPLKADADSS